MAPGRGEWPLAALLLCWPVREGAALHVLQTPQAAPVQQAHVVWGPPGYLRQVVSEAAGEKPRLTLESVDAQVDTLVTSVRRSPPRAQGYGPTQLAEQRPGQVVDLPAEAFYWHNQSHPHHHSRSSRYVVFIIKCAIILGAALFLFFVYRALYDHIERVTGIGVQHISCLVFMLLSVSTDLSTKAAAGKGGGGYKFDPAVAVVVVESSKLVVSAILLLLTMVGQRRAKAQDGAAAAPALVLPTLKDLAILAVPGFVYTCNNILVFEAIEKVPIATFAVVRETRLIWNALIWMAIFKISLGGFRWAAIIGVLVGCTANQVPKMLQSEFTWGVMYAVLLAFLNASGGVVCEFAMKRKASLDINMQNSIIYTSCSLLALLYLAIFRTGVFAGASAFFRGFEPECLQVVVLQVITGLTVSRILKHVESVTKSMVAALCSPIICFIGSWALGTGLNWSEILAALVVVASCLLFLRQGPLAAPAAPKLEASAGKAP